MQTALPTQVNIHEAKTRLSQLIEQVEAGGEVVIARAGSPVVRLVAITQPRPRRVLGTLAGHLPSTGDYHAPLPDELLDAFEGR
ncbi:type II toxin-antitoxin system Phd/YefM family antitoxin [uncultured Thiodictyon sp.]|jgi:prevent-host-death family protein|uniref:type II toxin-antitoxin system Phd/YefM family antitoxin n=1 Tax=uncultured Thiodictyon sp. TaxID=1846217 RepID=UPI0025F04F7D|nr:type II toxin-antitoxin system prevent-host-death family antitoxin [uncultured Thiodictyon sp.]